MAALEFAARADEQRSSRAKSSYRSSSALLKFAPWHSLFDLNVYGDVLRNSMGYWLARFDRFESSEAG